MSYWPNIRTFQYWKEKADEGGSVEEVEGEVSYSVSSDLQIT